MAAVLLVEDERIVADDIANSLQTFGYTVCGVASSGADALNKVKETRPDLILMDIVLKGDADGIETAHKMKSLFDIPVIYLTAHADDDTLARARVTEPYGYVIKPFQERELHAAVEMALHKHKMEKK